MHALADFVLAGTGVFALFQQLPPLLVQLLAQLLLIAHAGDRGIQFAAGGTGLRLDLVQALVQFFDFAADLLHARLHGVELAALAMDLAGHFGQLPMPGVELALGPIAVALDLQQLQTQLFLPRQHAINFLLQLRAAGLQRLNFAFAREHTHLRLIGTEYAHPIRPQPFAGGGNHRVASAERGRHGGGPRQRIGHPHPRQQSGNRGRSAHLGGQGLRRRFAADTRLHQGDIGSTEIAQLFERLQRLRRHHRIKPASEHGFHRALPTLIDLQHSTQPRRLAQTNARQPFGRTGSFLSERGVLQGFQRAQPSTRRLQGLPRSTQLRL